MMLLGGWCIVNALKHDYLLQKAEGGGNSHLGDVLLHECLKEGILAV